MCDKKYSIGELLYKEVFPFYWDEMTEEKHELAKILFRLLLQDGNHCFVRGDYFIPIKADKFRNSKVYLAPSEEYPYEELLNTEISSDEITWKSVNIGYQLCECDD